MKKSVIIALIALTLIVGCVVGGTLAWLTATTVTVTNTFTVGDINIELTETGTTDNKKNYDYIPGDVLAKDPKVTVEANSESAYIFLRVDVDNNEVDDLTVIQWAIADGWTYIVDGAEADVVDFTKNGTYYFYRTYTATATDTDYQVLAGGNYGEVKVNGNVTKAQVDDILETKKPTLVFTAAAVQSVNIGGLANAWDAVPAGFTN